MTSTFAKPQARYWLLARTQPTITASRSKLRLAQAAMGKTGTIVADLCEELGISSQTLYRHVSPAGELRTKGKRIISGGNF